MAGYKIHHQSVEVTFSLLKTCDKIHNRIVFDVATSHAHERAFDQTPALSW